MGNDHRDRCTRPLPPGFRFRPTDEELLTHYLARKAADAGFCPAAVSEVDLYKAEPWDLLPPAAGSGDDDYAGGEDGCRYFFCARRVKFPSGMRTNRATPAGYWKSTGKDKVVARHGDDGVEPLGVKKTLVFYRGRAPRGDKTNWIMHEYRLVPGHASCSQKFARGGAHQIEWVVCRVFLKKQPAGEASHEQQDTILQPPLGAHLQMSTDGKTSSEMAAAAGSEHTMNFFTDAQAMAPIDHDTYQGLMQLSHEDLLLNCPMTDDDLYYSALAQATLFHEEQASNSSFNILPQLLDYEGLSFVHDF